MKNYIVYSFMGLLLFSCKQQEYPIEYSDKIIQMTDCKEGDFPIKNKYKYVYNSINFKSLQNDFEPEYDICSLDSVSYIGYKIINTKKVHLIEQVNFIFPDNQIESAEKIGYAYFKENESFKILKNIFNYKPLYPIHNESYFRDNYIITLQIENLSNDISIDGQKPQIKIKYCVVIFDEDNKARILKENNAKIVLENYKIMSKITEDYKY